MFNIYEDYKNPYQTMLKGLIEPGWGDFSNLQGVFALPVDFKGHDPDFAKKAIEELVVVLSTMEGVEVDIIGAGTKKLVLLRADDGVVIFDRPLPEISTMPAGQPEKHVMMTSMPLVFGKPDFLVRLTDFIAQVDCETKSRPRLDKHGDPIRTFHIKKLFMNPDETVNVVRSVTSTEEMEDIRTELYPYMNVDLFVNQYLKSASMVAIFGGGPGTGKTCLTRYISKRMAIEKGGLLDVMYIKDLRLLESDGVWASISEASPDLIVLDDFDHGLEQRTDENPNLVMEKLLSFTNGFQKEDCKLLITTNRSLENTDKAMARTGRCFCALELPYLDYHSAMELWMNVYGHSKESFREIFKEDMKVSQSDLDSEAKLYVEFENKGFLYDTSIDIQPSLQPEDRRNLNDKAKFDLDLPDKPKLQRGFTQHPVFAHDDTFGSGGFH